MWQVLLPPLERFTDVWVLMQMCMDEVCSAGEHVDTVMMSEKRWEKHQPPFHFCHRYTIVAGGPRTITTREASFSSLSWEMGFCSPRGPAPVFGRVVSICQCHTIVQCEIPQQPSAKIVVDIVSVTKRVNYRVFICFVFWLMEVVILNHSARSSPLSPPTI